MPVDLNADLGESFGRWRLGDDEALLTMITSANVACGFHAGDPATLRRTCRSAVERGVVIGAQVGYPDLVGFGRRFLDIAADDLAAAVVYQIGALDALARSVGGAVALREAARRSLQRDRRPRGPGGAVIEAIVSLDDRLPLLGLPGSAVLGIAARRGLRTVTEYFVDRNYTADGRLVDRRLPDALITDADLAAERAVGAARSGVADSLCLHGDSPGAVTMATTVRAALLDAGIDAGAVRRGPRMSRRLLAVRGARAAARVRGPDRDRRRAACPPAARPRRGDRDRARSADDLLRSREPLSPRRQRELLELEPVSRSTRLGAKWRSGSDYDGADLTEVAELVGLTPDEVIAAHTGQAWTVGFCGFAPGFGYLHGENERLRVPRRAQPRTSVPAGAVGLADVWSGHLPAPRSRRLAADRPHHADPVGPGPDPAGAAATRHRGPLRRRRRLEVLVVDRTGAQALLQDLGRAAGAPGVSPSGAADRAALRLANRLVGNPEGAAADRVPARRAGGDGHGACTGSRSPERRPRCW